MDPFIYRECRATITARIPDTVDADLHPDRVLVQGRGTAHPQFQGGSVVFTEVGEYAIPQPVPVVIVDGELLVEVLAGDESVETQPLFLPVTVDERANQNWSWRLVFDFLTLGEYGEEVSHPPLSFPVEAGDGPLEISTVATPVIKSSGFVTRGAPGAGLQEITAENGELVFQWDNGKSTTIEVPDNVPGPRGPEGPPGSVELTGVVPEIIVGTDYVRVGGREVVQDGDVGAGMPVFPSLSRASMWESLHPGRTALWVDGTPPVDTGLLPAFFDAQTGAAPAGWTERFNPDGKVATLRPDGHLRLAHTLGSGTAKRWALTKNGITSSTTVDAVMRIRQTYPNSGAFGFGIIVGGSGTGDGVTGIVALTASGGEFIRVQRYLNGVAEDWASSPNPVPEGWAWMRFRVVAGRAYARLWADGTSEPAEWHRDLGIVNRTGWVGIWGPNDSEADVSFFNVRTDGSAAPIVVT